MSDDKPWFNEARVEEVAREYCRLKGLNPDDDVPNEEANRFGGAYYITKRWREVANRVRDEWTMSAANCAPTKVANFLGGSSPPNYSGPPGKMFPEE